MKKALCILLPLLILGLLGTGAYMFREQIIDLLPIDQSGWEELDGKTLYLNEKGDPVTGWQEIGGKRYYFAADGAMQTGWVEADGQKYYLAENGNPYSGWLSDDSADYYILSGGIPAQGWQEIQGRRHHFTENGTPTTGWFEVENGRIYLLSDGSIATGWQDIDEKRYFFNGDGSPFQGWLTTSDGTVYLIEDGSVASGWVVTEEGRYCFDENGTPLSGWQEDNGSRYYLDEAGRAVSGWIEADGQKYYLGDDCAAYSGWLEQDGDRYYFDETGAAVTGWLEDNGYKYYLTDNGVVKGKHVIGETTYYFTSTGANIILVNPWNYLPEDFTVDLVETPGGLVAPECKEPLEQMLADCRAAGYYPRIVSSYRSIADQRANLNNLIAANGYSYETAIKIVAIPGTSEHHLGLAVDIVDSGYTKLNYQQANTPTQKWLMENCWRYGFIMRYPDGSTDITGIIYEPWHYRYVGPELAKELYELGNIPLEVYLDRLTNDGTTCGGKLVTE